jgi:hypothetical protein
MTKRFRFGTLAYAATSFAFAAPWHFVRFQDVRHRLGMSDRAEPIVPTGLPSLVVRGALIASYPYFGGEQTPVRSGLPRGGFMGLFPISASTSADAARIQVSSLGLRRTVQGAFPLLQFAAVGLAVGRTTAGMSNSPAAPEFRLEPPAR